MNNDEEYNELDKILHILYRSRQILAEKAAIYGGIAFLPFPEQHQHEYIEKEITEIEDRMRILRVKEFAPDLVGLIENDFTDLIKLRGKIDKILYENKALKLLSVFHDYYEEYANNMILIVAKQPVNKILLAAYTVAIQVVMKSIAYLKVEGDIKTRKTFPLKIDE